MCEWQLFCFLPLIYTLSFETSITTINTRAECGEECSHYARYELNMYIHGIFCTSMTTAVWRSTCRRRCGDGERYGRPVEENQQRTMSSKTSVIGCKHQLPLLWICEVNFSIQHVSTCCIFMYYVDMVHKPENERKRFMAYQDTTPSQISHLWILQLVHLMKI